RFLAFAKVESSILVSSVVQWPEVRSEVRSSPDCECGLDPLQAPQKQNLNELRFLLTVSDFFKQLLHLISIENEQLFAILTHENEVVEDQKLDMVFGLIIHEERARTLFIFSNLGIGFKSTFLPSSSIKIA